MNLKQKHDKIYHNPFSTKQNLKLSPICVGYPTKNLNHLDNNAQTPSSITLICNNNKKNEMFQSSQIPPFHIKEIHPISPISSLSLKDEVSYMSRRATNASITENQKPKLKIQSLTNLTNHVSTPSALDAVDTSYFDKNYAKPTHASGRLSTISADSKSMERNSPSNDTNKFIDNFPKNTNNNNTGRTIIDTISLQKSPLNIINYLNEKRKLMIKTPSDMPNDSGEYGFARINNPENEKPQKEVIKVNNSPKNSEMIILNQRNKDTVSHLKSFTLKRPLSTIGTSPSSCKIHVLLNQVTPLSVKESIGKDLQERPSTTMGMKKCYFLSESKQRIRIKTKSSSPDLKLDGIIAKMESQMTLNENLKESNNNEHIYERISHAKSESNVDKSSKPNKISMKDISMNNTKGKYIALVDDKLKYIQGIFNKNNTHENHNKPNHDKNTQNGHDIDKVDKYELKRGSLDLEIIDNVNDKKNEDFSQKQFNELQQDISSLNTKLDHLMRNNTFFNNNIEKYDFLNVNPAKLCKVEIDFIREEYLKKDRNMDISIQWERLDKILSRIKFFSKYLKHIRLSLMKCASLVEYNPGEIVFRQGDIGDLMYVILSGSVNVRTRLRNPEGVEQDMLIACLYEGDSFGELSMLGAAKKPEKITTSQGVLLEQIALPKTYKQIKKDLYHKKPNFSPIVTQINGTDIKKTELGVSSTQTFPNEKVLLTDQRSTVKRDINENNNIKECSSNEERKQFEITTTQRSATIEVGMTATLLSIPRQHFRELLVTLMQAELDQKVKLLESISFLENQGSLSLLPIANNMQTKQFKMGETIIKKGEIPTYLGIISQGRCNVMIEFEQRRNIPPTPFMRGQMATLKNFSFGRNNSMKETPIKITNTNKMDSVKTNIMSFTKKKTKTFDFDPLKASPENGSDMLKQNMIISTLRRGDFFGIRTLLNDVPHELTHTVEQIENFQAKLNIIAVTGVVEIYTLNRDRLQFIPDYLQKILIEALKQKKDFDDYNVEDMKKGIDEWNMSIHKEAYKSLLETYSQRQKYTSKSDYKKF